MKEYRALGLMSGTSLDGLDLAFAQFTFHKGFWSFDLLKSQTIPYDLFWRQKLENAPGLSGDSLNKLHVDYGRFLGKVAADFIKRNGIKPDLVASHGHTVFHNPNQGYTFQIGSGPAIAVHLFCPVCFDFRSEDVALGGQGAPLVPIGDELLFGDYDACVNLGGFANISTKIQGQRRAWDIGPANIILNTISRKMGFEFDEKGKLARKGILNSEVMGVLNQIEFYQHPAPKSLGREWVEEVFWPMLDSFKLNDSDLLTTLTEHIAFQVSQSVKGIKGKVLFTGRGVKNDFLMERITDYSGGDIVIPDEEIVDFKEAIIFAFMGVLRMENMENILNSVTGARHSVSAGSCVFPNAANRISD